MWSKGAVVIVRHGDKDIADAIESGLDSTLKFNYVPVLNSRTPEQWDKMIKIAEKRYGYNYNPPTLVRSIMSLWYGFLYYTMMLGKCVCNGALRLFKWIARSVGMR